MILPGEGSCRVLILFFMNKICLNQVKTLDHTDPSPNVWGTLMSNEDESYFYGCPRWAKISSGTLPGCPDQVFSWLHEWLARAKP